MREFCTGAWRSLLLPCCAVVMTMTSYPSITLAVFLPVFLCSLIKCRQITVVQITPCKLYHVEVEAGYMSEAACCMDVEQYVTHTTQQGPTTISKLQLCFAAVFMSCRTLRGWLLSPQAPKQVCLAKSSAFVTITVTASVHQVTRALLIAARSHCMN